MTTKNTNIHYRRLGRHGPQSQRGYTTLIVAVVILFALTLITIYAGKITVTELNTSSNEARTKEAQAAAEEAVDRTVAYLNRNRGDLAALPWAVCPTDTMVEAYKDYPCGDGDANLFSSMSVYAVPPPGNWIYTAIPVVGVEGVMPGAGVECAQGRCASVDVLTQDLDGGGAPDERPIVYIAAEGMSNDGTARAIVRQAVVLTPEDTGPVVDAPLVTPGEIGGGGTFDVVANPNVGGRAGVALSAWAGNNTTLGGTGKTCHLGEFLSTDSGYIDTPYTFEGEAKVFRHCPSCACPAGDSLSSAGVENYDILDVDGNQGVNQDTDFPDDVFQYLFGIPESEYQQVKDQAADNNRLISDCATLTTASAGLYWYEGGGDCRIDNNAGTLDGPILLVVENSEVRLAANTQVFGLIFSFDPPPVSGASSVRVAGGATLVGAILSNRRIDFGSGNMVVRFDPYVLSKLNEAISVGPDAGKLPGSWADFRLLN